MRKLNVAIFAGLVVALLGFGGVFYYAQTVDSRIANGRQTVNVLVATAPLKNGATAGSLSGQTQTKAVPRAYVADGYLSDLGQVSTLVLLGPVAPGVQLNRADFGQPDVAGAMAITPKPGRLAVAIGVGLDPGVDRYVTANSKVDLFVTFGTAAIGGMTTNGAPATSAQAQTLLSRAGVQDTTGRTRLFLSSVTVLSVTEAAAPPVGTSTTSATGTVPTNVLLVLDLSPADSEKVINAQVTGSIYVGLAYSKVADDGTIEGETHTTNSGVTSADVINPQIMTP